MLGIPEKLINARVYRNGSEFLGVASVDLPQFQSMTTSISGSGIAGEIDAVVTGHYQSMSTTIKFRTLTPDAVVLAAPEPHELTFRASIDVVEPLTAARTVSAVKVWMKCLPKSTSVGNYEPGNAMDSDIEMEVLAAGVWIDGDEMIYIDKLNYIARIKGTDYLADAKVAEGLG